MSLISRLNSPHDFEEEFVIDNYIEIFHHLRATFLIFMCTGKDVGSPFVGELSYLFVFLKLRTFLIIVGMVIDMVIEWRRRGSFFYSRINVPFDRNEADNCIEISCSSKVIFLDGYSMAKIWVPLYGNWYSNGMKGRGTFFLYIHG